jgi:hypothetical protein
LGKAVARPRENTETCTPILLFGPEIFGRGTSAAH